MQTNDSTILRSRAREMIPPSTPSWRRALQRQPHVNIALLVATLATTTWAGAMYQGVSLWREPGQWTVGLPYALAVLFILGVHEMGHYLAARYHRVRASLPYFIPIPFAIGTLGAFIRMDEEPGERGKAFDIAIAGPLAGLAAALGVLAVGLHWPGAAGAAPPVDTGSSMLLGVLANVLGHDTARLASSPLVFAGWLGLLLTAFNLLPIGQLDGGHMARALFGERAAVSIGRVTLAGTVLLGLFVWHGFLLWALVALALGGSGSSPARVETTERSARWLLLDSRRVALAAAAFALIALILVPLPGAASNIAAECPWQ